MIIYDTEAFLKRKEKYVFFLNLFFEKNFHENYSHAYKDRFFQQTLFW